MSEELYDAQKYDALKEENQRLREENRELVRASENMKRRVTRLERDKQYSAITAENIERMRDFNAKEKEIQHLYNQLLLSNCPDLVFVFDRELKFLLGTEMSSAILRFSSYNDFAEKPLEHVFSRRFPPKAVSSLTGHCHEVMWSGVSCEYSEKLEDETGTTFLTITISSAKNLEGDCMGVVIVLHDVTDLTRLKETAEKSSVAKSIFLATMSHEMRTPMNAVIGMSSIAKNTNDMEKMRYCMDKIENASIHLLGVINDILDISKIEAGKFELSYGRFDFEKMVSKVVGVQTFRIDEKKQTLRLFLDRDLPRFVKSDEQHVAQVITNLLANAVKFTPEAGEISLSVHKIGESETDVCLEIAVADNGIGMTKEQQGRLFRSFEQADGGISRRFGGTGLGLVISKNIVELLGGRISVTSELDKGSRFAFTLCVEKCAEQNLPLIHAPQTDWSKINILAVDDSEEVLEFFDAIGSSLGLHCDVAPSGEKALERLQAANVPYDIIFVDWIMPGMDGIELTRKIKTMFGEGTVVIMISAAEWSRMEAEAIKAGVDRFLPKPLFPSTISECICDCLNIIATDGEEQATPPVRKSLAGKRILLAEDVDINREIVIALLEDTEVEIVCAQNGEEAMTLFAQSPEAYDLIFMDIHMPKVDGYEATRQIRAMDVPKAHSIPIIAMTANVFREDVEKCLACGMNDHIGKPIDLDDMIGKLHHYL